MRTEYRIAHIKAILMWVFIPFNMLLYAWLASTFYTEATFDLPVAITITLFTALIEFILTLGLIYLYKNRLIIENERITSIGIFKIKQLSFQQIEGFKLNSYFLSYIPINKNDASIKISSHFGQFEELVVWSRQHFKNLDEEAFEQSEKEILKNTAFGSTDVERANQLTKAKKVTNALNAVAWIAGLSFFVYPNFYKIQLLVCGILPILGIIIFNFSNGLIGFSTKTSTAHPSILYTLLIPSSALFLRALLDITVFDYSNIWIPAILICLFFGILILKKIRINFNFKKGTTHLAIVGILMVGSLYAYGILITTNVMFDQSLPTFYDAQVIGKHRSRGKGRLFQLKLSTWGPQLKEEFVSVDERIYNDIDIGDSTTVFFSAGLFQIPYYDVFE